MAIDIVKQIIEVERDGDDLVKKARQRATEILKEAREEAEVVISKAKNDADIYYKNVILSYETKAFEETKPLLEKTSNTKEQFEKMPATLIDKAVALVIERIVNIHGNS